MRKLLFKSLNHFASFVLLLAFFFITQTFGLSYAEEAHFIKARKLMLEKDLIGRDITDKKVLKAMNEVKRHLFVNKFLQKIAYADRPLPIGEGQTISQPYVVALMTQVLDISPGEKVLEIGTGSGYQAAVLAKLTDHVFSIEIKEELYKKTAERLKNLGYNTIKLKYGDGYLGWSEFAPFDAIIITAGAEKIPQPLMDQLKTGGRLVMPLGKINYYQALTKVTKREEGNEVENITVVAFVPMTGQAQE